MSGNGAYMTAEEIAGEQGVSVHTVRRYFRRDVDPLPGRKVGHGWRTTRAAYEAWLAGHVEAPRRRRDDQPQVVMLADIEVALVPDVDPATFLIHLSGEVHAAGHTLTSTYAVTGDGLAALVAACMAQAPLAPEFTDSLMARLADQSAPHTHEHEHDD